MSDAPKLDYVLVSQKTGEVYCLTSCDAPKSAIRAIYTTAAKTGDEVRRMERGAACESAKRHLAATRPGAWRHEMEASHD
jgi:hypothetical protein